jgi:hypothetical protein
MQYKCDVVNLAFLQVFREAELLIILLYQILKNLNCVEFNSLQELSMHLGFQWRSGVLYTAYLPGSNLTKVLNECYFSCQMEILQLELREALFLPSAYRKFMFWLFVCKSDCCYFAAVLKPF